MLTKILNSIIEENGHISISNFIKLALYHPQYGYYKTKNPFGMGGDFITAPQISQLFNEIISLFFIYQFQKHWKVGQKIYFIEYGAGNGFFIKDFLTLVSKVKNLKENLEVILVETSHNLQTEQKEKLKDFMQDIQISWQEEAQEALNVVPDSEESIIFVFSNEFFDAFPINQYIKHKGKWHEICIIKNDQNSGYDFAFTNLDYKAAIKKHLEVMGIEEEVVKDGEIVEVSNDAIEIFTETCKKIKKNRGAVMTIDYGYLKTEFQSTLQSIKNHKPNNVLENIGEADLTYLVNFEFLFHTAQNEGLTCFTPITQKEFLTSIGILEKQKILLEKEKDEAKKHLIKQSTERIVSEAQMGNLFKVFICERW